MGNALAWKNIMCTYKWFNLCDLDFEAFVKQLEFYERTQLTLNITFYDERILETLH
jgi:hypothetical protein